MNEQLAILADIKDKDAIKEAIGPTPHWIGARCKRYLAYSTFYWSHANNTRQAFLERLRGEFLMEICDAREAGIVFSSKGFSDEMLEKLHPFICQYQ